MVLIMTWKPWKWALHWQILLALGLASIAGLGINLSQNAGHPLANGLLATCDFLGKGMFMNALKMIVVPLIVSSIMCGVMSLGNDRNFGRMGVKTLSYYMVSGMLAILVGLILVNLLRPGTVDPQTAEAIIGQQESSPEFLARFQDRGANELTAIFLRMLPPNIIEAATDNGQLLGLIVFSLLFGFFVSKLPQKLREFQGNLWESIQAVMMMVTDLIIRLAPIGVFALVTPVLARAGLDAFSVLAMFALTVVLSLGVHVFVTLPLLLRWVGKVNPWTHLRAMSPVLLTAFSTASSASTLPVTLDTVEKQAKVSNRTASFTLPLGATVNMDGTALYECVVVVFIMQFYAVVYGFDIGLGTQATVVILALLTSIGVAGIPSASLVAIAVILGAIGIPVEAVGLVWVTDRILDMTRTAVNVYSDTVGAVIIASTEGEKVYPDNP